MGPPRVLCLHGSRQDGEVLSQRLRTLERKLAGLVVRGGRAARGSGPRLATGLPVVACWSWQLFVQSCTP